VISREMSIAVESRDVNLVFGKISKRIATTFSFYVPILVIDLVFPWNRLGNG
jgi:hypothetical protein